MELKLGKLEPRIDKRTIPLSIVLIPEKLPVLPESFDVDESLGGIEDNFMYSNSEYGDCVIASQAHQVLRFEKFEQGTQIAIPTQDVVDQYFKESGNVDTGLVMLDSLKEWRKNGKRFAGRDYKIYAFASVDWKDHEQVKHAIHLLGGVNFGMTVFDADVAQFNDGEGWHLTDNNGLPRGGHGLYGCKYRGGNGIIKTQFPDSLRIVSYNQDGLWAMTWARKQFMDWDFWDSRLDECYAIVDSRDDWLGDDSPVDVGLLGEYLKEITGESGTESGCRCPFIGNLIAKVRR